MAAEFWVRVGGVWRQAREVWFRSSGAWQLAKSIYYRKSGAWNLVHTGPPELVSASASSINHTDVSDVQLNIVESGTVTGWTLQVEVAWTGIGGYTTVFYLGNGGSTPLTIPYWGSAFIAPANPGEALSTDALIRVSLKNGFGAHAVGSPRVLGPGISL